MAYTQPESSTWIQQFVAGWWLMAVLVEGISVIVKLQSVMSKYPGGWGAFKSDVPNDTLCADSELARVGFLSPAMVEVYVATLELKGLKYLSNGEAQDIVVVDQIRGPMAKCDWIEYGHVEVGDEKKSRVAAAMLKGSNGKVLMYPDWWVFEGSLTEKYVIIPA